MPAVNRLWMRQLVLAALALLLVVCTAAVLPAHAAPTTTAGFSATEQANTLKFLRAFITPQSGLAELWTGTDFCRWSGVECRWTGPVLTYPQSAEVGNVTLPELPADVDGAQVALVSIARYNYGDSAASALPASWGRLARLTSVSLRRVGGTLPAAWGSLAALQSLTLSNNKLEGSLPAAWGSLTALRVLALENNGLSGTVPAAWGSLQSLTHISLSENALSGPLAEELAWSKRTRVYIRANRFCGCLPKVWTNVLSVDADWALTAPACATANACPPPACAVPSCAACQPGSAAECALCESGFVLSASRCVREPNAASLPVSTAPAAAMAMCAALASCFVLAI